MVKSIRVPSMTQIDSLFAFDRTVGIKKPKEPTIQKIEI